MSDPQRPIAVSLGDPAGVGPDVILKSWLERKQRDLPPFAVLAPPRFLESRAARLNLNVPIEQVTFSQASAVWRSALPVVPLSDEIIDRPGEIRVDTAILVLQSIDRAVAAVLANEACALVTAPIQKKALYDAGFVHPGHTEYLAELARHNGAPPARPVMMLAGPELLVVPVTIHIPLKDVPAALTTELIVETARIVDRDLKRRFGLASPRIAMCGLNPHAGEDGGMGREDIEIIAPAIRQLKSEGVDVSGPFPADTMFCAQARKTYDCALAMYHDQGLIPAKTLAFDEAVNVTLGLPFIRTSPDHGTALDIAGTGKALPDSFAAALRMASVLSAPDSVKGFLE